MGDIVVFERESCPRCLSHYRSIHGVIFRESSSYLSDPCDHNWHRGPNYQPEVLNLTEEDEVFMRGLKIWGD
jgi:transposase-like protein